MNQQTQEKVRYSDDVIASKGVFFARDVYSARERLAQLANDDFYKEYYANKRIRLSETQVKHINGWLTFEVV